MDLITKIFGIGIFLSVAVKVLEKADKNDVALLLSLGGLIIVMSMVVIKISEFFNAVKNIFNL